MNGDIYLDLDSEHSERLLSYKKNLFYNKLINIKITNSNNIKYKEYTKEINFSKNINLFDKISIKIKFNKPNNVILLCNIRKSVSIYFLYKVILKLEKPSLMKFIYKKNKKTKMCIIKFEEIKQFINIILNLNNKKLGKYKLKASFTFNRFVKI